MYPPIDRFITPDPVDLEITIARDCGRCLLSLLNQGDTVKSTSDAEEEFGLALQRHVIFESRQGESLLACKKNDCGVSGYLTPGERGVQAEMLRTDTCPADTVFPSASVPKRQFRAIF